MWHNYLGEESVQPDFPKSQVFGGMCVSLLHLYIVEKKEIIVEVIYMYLW